MPGVVLAVIVALIVSSYLKRRKKKEQARLSPADERKLSARQYLQGCENSPAERLVIFITNPSARLYCTR